MVNIRTPHFLIVRDIAPLAPNHIRVIFGVDRRENWANAGVADFITLYFPDPLMLDQGAGQSATHFVGRDYTVRHHRLADGEITIDFALCANGPATQWVQSAACGDRVRGSLATIARPDKLPLHAADYLIAGDDASLPAIARHLEGSGPFAKVTVLIESADVSQIPRFGGLAEIDAHWRLCNKMPGAALSQLLDKHLPGKSFDCAWLAGEASAVARLRAQIEAQAIGPVSTVQSCNFWNAESARSSACISVS